MSIFNYTLKQNRDNTFRNCGVKNNTFEMLFFLLMYLGCQHYEKD